MHGIISLPEAKSYVKVNVLKLFPFFSQNQIFVIRVAINKLIVRIANREDPDQIASSEAVWSGSALFVYAFLAGN